MTNPILIPQPFANGGNKNDIQNTRQIGQDPEDATWEDGFPNVTMQPADVGGIPPKGLDFNGVFHALSGGIYFLQKGGRYQFDASLSPYPKNAIVQSDDGLKEFQSTIDNNSNNPNSNMTGWKLYAGDGFIVDALTSNDATKSLSAKQGNVLNTNKADKNDSRFGDAREWTAATVSQAEAETGTATTRRAWTAQRVRQAATAMLNAATTTFTRTLLGRTTAAQVRSDLELGTAATKNTGESSGNVLEVGSFGYGLRKALSPDDANTSFEGNRWAPNASAAGAPPLGTAAYVTGTMYPSSKWSLLNWQNITNGRHFFKLSNASGVWGEWHEYLTSVNTTTDINGFLRDSGSANAVPETRTITAGTGLSGGGNLSANRTLSVNYGTTAGTAVQGNDTRIVNAVQTAGTGLSKSGTALSVNYGTTVGTAAQGNDARINNGQTAYSWGNHANAGYLVASKNLSDLSSAATARTNLGLGNAATHDVTTSQVAHVDDLVMQTGYGGLVKGVSLGTFNLANPSGFMGFQYEASGSTAGSPGGSAWVINLGNASVNYAHQIGAGIARNELRFRHKNNGTWQDWKTILDNSNVVQELGISTSNIISQKAVTDALNLKLNANANAVSATKLQTARTIGGVSFDGTANINLPGVNIAGNQNTSGNAATATSAATCTGNAATATKLATARSVTVTGAIAGTFVFDGSSNVTYNVTLKHGLGIEQTYRDLSASRVSGTTYTNTTGSPIEVMVKLRNNGFPSVGGVAITGTGTDSENTYTFTVSNGQTYMCNGTIVTWAELR